MTLSTAESATAPSFGAYFVGVLPKKRVRTPRWKMAVYSVEGRRAERLKHLEDTHVHPGRSAGFWIVQLGDDPRRDET